MPMYLIDNNALGPLGDRKKSPFFREHCRVPAEVAHESRRAKHAKLLEPLTIEMTPAMLAQLSDVMKTVPVGHTKFIDLYNYKGTADPILVALAVVLSSEDLFSDNWVIVTQDKEVVAKAKAFSVDTMTPKALASIIDAATKAA
ncbi:hypothetical protein FHP29_08975 [Nocardioides albidus]|uniref:PIN domain-containing protein n=1 Tax=Nocardioides albidus TaxID=1517589 RepID=A0A5C4W0P1_9ACTN|nr:hypothetical protein [Nocardioides albidus]TNM41136.1 hypothetical protein FHP29_08975 [Nocardioides albidus]